MPEFSDAVRFHGHACPGLAYGFRVAQAALRKLGERSRDEGLVAVVENRSCAVDAIQVVSGCTFGKGNMILTDHGKQVYSFMNRQTGKGIRLAVIWQPPPEDQEIKQLFKDTNNGIRTPEMIRALHAHKGAKIKAILAAPEEDLLKIEEKIFTPPPLAQVFKSLRCSQCNEKVMEPMAKKQDGKTFCQPCLDQGIDV